MLLRVHGAGAGNLCGFSLQARTLLNLGPILDLPNRFNWRSVSKQSGCTLGCISLNVLLEPWHRRICVPLVSNPGLFAAASLLILHTASSHRSQWVAGLCGCLAGQLEEATCSIETKPLWFLVELLILSLLRSVSTRGQLF